MALARLYTFALPQYGCLFLAVSFICFSLIFVIVYKKIIIIITYISSCLVISENSISLISAKIWLRILMQPSRITDRLLKFFRKLYETTFLLGYRNLSVTVVSLVMSEFFYLFLSYRCLSREIYICVTPNSLMFAFFSNLK